MILQKTNTSLKAYNLDLTRSSNNFKIFENQELLVSLKRKTADKDCRFFGRLFVEALFVKLKRDFLLKIRFYKNPKKGFFLLPKALLRCGIIVNNPRCNIQFLFFV